MEEGEHLQSIHRILHLPPGAPLSTSSLMTLNTESTDWIIDCWPRTWEVVARTSVSIYHGGMSVCVHLGDRYEQT